MKIYIEHPELDETGIPKIDSFNNKCTSIMMLLFKYQLMWVLRNLEDEINFSNGIIRINEDGSPTLINFAQELRDKIEYEFKNDAGSHYGVIP